MKKILLALFASFAICSSALADPLLFGPLEISIMHFKKVNPNLSKLKVKVKNISDVPLTGCRLKAILLKNQKVARFQELLLNSGDGLVTNEKYYLTYEFNKPNDHDSIGFYLKCGDKLFVPAVVK